MTSLNWQKTPENAASGSTTSQNNPWFGATMALLGVIVGYTVGNSFGAPGVVANNPQVPNVPDAPSAPAPEFAQDMPPIDPATDHIRGNPDAKVAIVEYSDFECPFCKRHHPTMTQLMTQYGDDVMWVLRHYPLSFHPSAQKAAEASECAAELGGNDKFWEMADKLMELDPMSNEAFVTIAGDIGLDAGDFKDCLDSGRHAQKVADQMSGGSAAGISGTPGSVLVDVDAGTNQIISGAVPLSSFTTVIDTILQ